MQRLVKPAPGQVTALSQLSNDLSNGSKYRQLLGPRAPEPLALQAKVDLASAWASELAAAKAWLEYAQDMAALSMDGVLHATKTLKREYDAAREDDAKVSEKLPGVAAFLGARSEVGARASLTRTKNKKAEKKAATKKTGS
jgi:hypothetical protein